MHPPPLEPGKYYHIYTHGVANRNLFEEKKHFERFLNLYEKYIEPIAETYAWVLMPNHFHCLVKIKENIVYKYRQEDFHHQHQPDSVNRPVRLGNDVKSRKAASPTFQENGDIINHQPDSVNRPVRLGNIERLKSINFNDVKWQTIEIDELIKDFNQQQIKYQSLTPPQPDRCGDAVRLMSDKLKMLKLTANKKIELLENNNYKVPIPHLHFSHLFNAYSRYFNKITDSRGTLFERPFNRVLVENEKYLKNLVVYIHNNPVRHGFCSHTIEYPWSSYLSFFSDNNDIVNRNDVIEWFGNIDNYKYMHNINIDEDEINNSLGIQKT